MKQDCTNTEFVLGFHVRLIGKQHGARSHRITSEQATSEIAKEKFDFLTGRQNLLKNGKSLRGTADALAHRGNRHCDYSS